MAPRDDLQLTMALNDAVLALAGQHGGFFFPACSVHPADGEAAVRELERVVGAGACWLKLALDAPDTRIILAHAHAMAFSSLLVYEILAQYPWGHIALRA